MTRKIARLKSTPPKYPLTPNIINLLQLSGVKLNPDALLTLSSEIQRDVLIGYYKLTELDREIGGVGFHNVNKQEGEWITGNYRVEFRPLFRPIQYVHSAIAADDLIWQARFIVQWSCGHLEDAVKFRFNIPSTFNASLGVILTRRPEIRKNLNDQIFDWLLMLNRIVYRGAKHAVEELNIDAHRFTPADAIAVYLMCRWVGVSLLEPTGLFDDWKHYD